MKKKLTNFRHRALAGRLEVTTDFANIPDARIMKAGLTPLQKFNLKYAGMINTTYYQLKREAGYAL